MYAPSGGPGVLQTKISEAIFVHYQGIHLLFYEVVRFSRRCLNYRKDRTKYFV